MKTRCRTGRDDQECCNISIDIPVYLLTVDFGDTEYWIGDQGPFKYGVAVTAFFIGENIGEVSNDGAP